MKLLILILFISINAHAADEWFCTEESGRRIGSVIQACGVGESAIDEGRAREKALEQALIEFHSICNISADCKGKDIIVEPKRLTCVVGKRGRIKCYRLIEVTVGR
jgi:hypothetical protein